MHSFAAGGVWGGPHPLNRQDGPPRRGESISVGLCGGVYCHMGCNAASAQELCGAETASQKDF